MDHSASSHGSMHPAHMYMDALRQSASSSSRRSAAAPASYPQTLFDGAAGRTGAQSPATHGSSTLQTRVKNTFLDVVESRENPHSGLQKSASDSELSSERNVEDDKLRFWLPSLSSSSHSSIMSVPTEDAGGAQPTAENSGASAAQPLAFHSVQLQADIASNRANQPVWLEERPSLPKNVSTRPQPKRGDPLSRPGGPESPASQQNRDLPPIVQQLHVQTGMPIADLMALHVAYDLSLVPRDLSTNTLLSVGSIKHNDANCTPCMFNVTRQCHKGIACPFCHDFHQGFKAKRYRAPKKKRDKMKAAANRADPFQDADSCSDEEHSQMASSSSTAPIGHLEATFANAGQDLLLGHRVRRMMTDEPNTKIRL